MSLDLLNDSIEREKRKSIWTKRVLLFFFVVGALSFFCPKRAHVVLLDERAGEVLASSDAVYLQPIWGIQLGESEAYYRLTDTYDDPRGNWLHSDRNALERSVFLKGELPKAPSQARMERYNWITMKSASFGEGKEWKAARGLTIVAWDLWAFFYVLPSLTLSWLAFRGSKRGRPESGRGTVRPDSD